ncbi:carboxypeptidase-like regulatory domain-containing protein [Flavihumibacter sp. UBA7668]|uniref:carboxypeptidase-like regulatory domain-containing protein n=1 Tax=Flavihumibacter sp. UBA7668 TaxID=1946542 RepID=UPI0025C13C75|nr:carboxypeptidase-like regulatory domain-containing protein [Flavihumibacter sp. UBA7668]
MACFLDASDSIAQQQLSGTIFDATTDSTLQDVFIINLNSNQTTVVSKSGRYNIPAAEGNRIVFTAIGYEPDTLKVEFHMFVTGYDISLKQRYNLLKTVVVTERDYQTDSLERREAYRHILDDPLPGITGRNTPSSGFGVVLSPASFFSSKSKQERELKKKLLYNEKVAYVDFKFSRSFVQRYTGLKGDSLQTFLLRFRPSYEFCRQSNQEDMINYINEKLKIYLRREENK